MRKLISIFLLSVMGFGIVITLQNIPFGADKARVSDYYVNKGVKETGAVNIVTAVVVNYRGFDTLGEIAVLFTGAIGLGAVLFGGKKPREKKPEPASLILRTGCKLLFPVILLFGIYVFTHGHLTPGGGFQGGAIIASAFLLIYLGGREMKFNKTAAKVTESFSGLIFVIMGLLGLTSGGYFLLNFLPKGTANTLFSAGIIPIIYIVIGLKVGSELAGIIENLIED